MQRLIHFVLLIGMIVVAAQSVSADPVAFSNVVALQDEGATRIDLMTNPGLTLIGPEITFLADITGTLVPGVATSLRVTYLETGQLPAIQNFQIPAFGTIPPPFTQLFTVTSTGATFQGVNSQLRLEIIESGVSTLSQTYTFNVVTPVPEPTTLILLGTGIIGLTGRLRRRFTVRRSR
jgi:hypothetical protein